MDYLAVSKVSSWLITTHNWKVIWYNQSIYIYTQVLIIIGAALTLKHAFKNKGRWPKLWLVSLLNGLQLELICYTLPFAENFWHSEAPVMLFGNRLPLHICLIYPCLYYTAAVFSSLLNIESYLQPLAAGILTVLIEVPYDLIGVKFVQWTWHDTDPNIGDRNYWVPWSSYYFHFVLSTSITAFCNSSSDLQKSKRLFKLETSFYRKWKSVLFGSLFSIPCLFASFAIFYHPLHDVLGIHTQPIFLYIYTISIAIIWAVGRNQNAQSKSAESASVILIAAYLIIHYSFFLCVAIFGDPASQISAGLHQPIGPCNQKEPMDTLFGMTLYREKYLCLKDYDEKYFDFHCIQNFTVPSNKVIGWYKVCGTEFENRWEYVFILATLGTVASIVFGSIYVNMEKHVEKKKKHI